jgi:hypothetical protein
MYTKEQLSKQRQKFWTRFGLYMKPVPGANGESVNWLNYKTGIRYIFFKVDVDRQQAFIRIELRHPQVAQRMQCYQQFVALKKLLQNTGGNEWHWQPNATDESGQAINLISQTLNGVNALDEADWPAIISFLKVRMLLLDAFWELVKAGFE